MQFKKPCQKYHDKLKKVSFHGIILWGNAADVQEIFVLQKKSF